MKTIRFLAILAALSAALVCEAAGPQVKNNFPKPPVAALKALKASVGKTFNSGWVFIDGKYIEPPYRVERYGNVLRVNGCQITGEVVPWDEFLKTQPGVKAVKSGGEDGAGAEAAAEPEPEPEPEDDADDAWENSLDDLFDDEPAAKKTDKKKGGYKPKPRKPAVTVTYTLEGEFVPNDKTKKMVERINAARTKLDSHLRAGGLCCFSSKYSRIMVDSRTAGQIMAKMPDLMKQHSDGAAFAQAMRAGGMSYFPGALIEDFFKNRLDYLKLSQRLKSTKDRVQRGL